MGADAVFAFVLILFFMKYLTIFNSDSSCGAFFLDRETVILKFSDGSSVSIKAGELRDIVWKWVGSLPDKFPNENITELANGKELKSGQ
jgi:hypothetical protein